MLAAVERCLRLLKGVSEADFLADEKLQYAVFAQFVILGEAANRVSREEQKLIPDLPWKEMIGLRNRIVHGYDSFDWEMIFLIAQRELEQVRTKLLSILEA